MDVPVVQGANEGFWVVLTDLKGGQKETCAHQFPCLRFILNVQEELWLRGVEHSVPHPLGVNKVGSHVWELLG